MLKKVIIGIICFILLVIAGAGIYIYTLDWNKHKALVAQRLTQITGLKSIIDGNLKVDIFPAPKITASRVKFFANNSNASLITINQITANLELSPLLDNKFIVQSMTLEQPSINITISENGELNWKNVGKNSQNKSGNVEMSFGNTRINNATIVYENLQTKQEYNIPNISATVNAPSLQGPYKTDGKFIHNNSEIKFKGTISQNKTTSVNMTIENAVTASKLTIEGTLGDLAKGNISFDTRNLAEIVNIVFGENTLNNNYIQPMFFSFQYNYNANMAKLDNFTTKYGRNITGSGNILLNFKNEKSVAAEFNMAQFDLNVLETIARDYIKFAANDGKFADIFLAPYNISFKLRSPSAFYKNTDAQNLNLGLSLNNGILDINNFGIVMPGETSFRTAGKINLSDKLQYIFNQSIKSEDFRTFASVFGIDLTKRTAEENKKSVFKRVAADVQLKGALDNFEIYAPKTVVDSTTLGFNIRYALTDGKKSINADIAASKVIFDKYVQIIPENLKSSSVKDKFIHQLNLIDWDNDTKLTAQISIEDAVYNKIPMQDIVFQFNKEQDNFNISNLSFKNIANAQLEIKADVEKAFSNPQFKELTYNVKSSNFPIFASSLGIDTGDKNLFKRKLFASQGALAGNFNDFSLSSVQKFGDTEFSFTGLVANHTNAKPAVNGDLELKTNNFANFIKALNLDYTPNIPVTTFSATGKIKGNSDIFEFSNINALIGANKIDGLVQFECSTNKPRLKAELNFDKFNANHWFNLATNNHMAYESDNADFIELPTFNENKIDYSSLQKLDFDIKATAQSFIYGNKSYLTTKTDMKLQQGVLNVVSFDTQSDKSTISGNFVLNSNGTPKIKGQYYIAGIKTPTLGGKIYSLSSGILSANGTFESDATSVDTFMNALNSSGSFQLTNTAMKGWDLDIIKFDIEQRKSVTGFEKFVRNSLTSGKSAFSKISGNYTIKGGNVSADKVLWQSPVVDMYMQLSLKFKDKSLDASFDTIYHNASFSDVLKFALDGELANPKLKLNLSDTITRIDETEKLANAAIIQRETEKNEKIKNKTIATQNNIDDALQAIARISSEAERFKPISSDRMVIKTYDNNMRDIQAAQQRLNDLRIKLQSPVDDKALMDIDSNIKSEIAKLQLVPKVLEDNYIVDGKYVYDEIFNKIAWLYDVASNNTAYFNELSEAYVKQIALMKNGTSPLSEEEENLLLQSIKKVSADMERLNKLHTKMRDDYLFIVDTSNIEAVQDNNEIAKQALNTMLSYAKTLNKDIINSIEDFIKALELETRDYEDYMVNIPQNAEEIDPSLPTTGSPKDKSETVAKNKEKAVKDVKPQTETSANDGSKDKNTPIVNMETAPETTDVLPAKTDAQTDVSADKKKIDEKLSQLRNIKSNLYELINNFRAEQKAKEEIKTAINFNAGGLSSLLSNILPLKEDIPTADKEVRITVAQMEAQPENSVIAENTSEIPTVVEKKIEMPIIPVEVVEETTVVPETAIIPEEIQLVETALPEEIHLAETVVPEEISLTKEDNIAVNTDIDLMQKTQTAFNDIIEQVKIEEEMMTKIYTEEAKPTVTLVQNNIVEPLKINIEDYTISATVSDAKPSLKRNPVIALNIGKELTSTAAGRPDIFNKKSGSKFKKARYGDVIKSFAGKPKTGQLIVARKAIQNRKIEPLETSLPTITAHTDNMSPSFEFALANVELKPMQNSFADNKYVFANSSNKTNIASGLVGKSALENKNTQLQTVYPQKYLFAANDNAYTKFSGILSKRVALTVK